MGQQRTFASEAWNRKGKRTRRERFLAEMDAVIPWARLIALFEPHYHKGDPGAGRPTIWSGCCGSTSSSSASTSRIRRRRARFTTASRCGGSRWGAGAIFEVVKGLLEEGRLWLKTGTIVDATIIAAPSSTKNATGMRDPEMRQTRKEKSRSYPAFADG